jgi:hypothetical protein
MHVKRSLRSLAPFPFREGGFGGEGYLWDKRYRDMAQRPCRQLEPQLSPILLNTALDFRPASPSRTNTKTCVFGPGLGTISSSSSASKPPIIRSRNFRAVELASVRTSVLSSSMHELMTRPPSASPFPLTSPFPLRLRRGSGRGRGLGRGENFYFTDPVASAIGGAAVSTTTGTSAVTIFAWALTKQSKRFHPPALASK